MLLVPFSFNLYKLFASWGWKDIVNVLLPILIGNEIEGFECEFRCRHLLLLFEFCLDI